MEDKKNIFKAVAEFQNEVPVIHQSTQGYGYTYANLNSIFEVIKPLLKKHGLGFTQLLEGENLKTVLFHIKTGETIESSVHIQQDVTLAKMNTFQVLGSAITYYRRYSLSAILGLITDKDIDACGTEEPVKATPKKAPVKKPAEPKSEPKLKEVLTKEHKDWNNCVAYLNKPKTKGFDGLEARFTITKEVKEAMIAESLELLIDKKAK